jgi:hypothetical protein
MAGSMTPQCRRSRSCKSPTESARSVAGTIPTTVSDPRRDAAGENGQPLADLPGKRVISRQSRVVAVPGFPIRVVTLVGGHPRVGVTQIACLPDG